MIRHGWLAVGLTAALSALSFVTTARAQAPGFCGREQRCPDPFLFTSVSPGLLDLGTQFLQRLTDESGRTSASESEGGGASSALDPHLPRYRSWAEFDAMSVRTFAVDGIPGDRRNSTEAIGGASMIVAPGVAVGMGIDQGWTHIDVPGFSQSAMLEMTQLGANATIDVGHWSLGLAATYGFGNVDSNRTAITELTAAYDAKLWGAIAELGYTFTVGQHGRIVPKVAVDWTQTQTGAFTETGGVNALSAPSEMNYRGHAYAGVEVGESWVAEHRLYDVSAYGRFVDVLAQSNGSVVATSVLVPTLQDTVQAIPEGQYGFDTGATVSTRFSQNLRVYAGYDARFREHFQSNSGTLGIELKW